jgi:hypothetical protein
VVQKEAYLDCGLDFCISCLVSFDSILSGFPIAWLVSNDWDCLMSLLKKSCVVFIIWKHYFGFLLWCFIWVDLAHAHTC